MFVCELISGGLSLFLLIMRQQIFSNVHINANLYYQLVPVGLGAELALKKVEFPNTKSKPTNRQVRFTCKEDAAH